MADARFVARVVAAVGAARYHLINSIHVRATAMRKLLGLQHIERHSVAPATSACCAAHVARGHAAVPRLWQVFAGWFSWWQAARRNIASSTSSARQRHSIASARRACSLLHAAMRPCSSAIALCRRALREEASHGSQCSAPLLISASTTALTQAQVWRRPVTAGARLGPSWMSCGSAEAD